MLWTAEPRKPAAPQSQVLLRVDHTEQQDKGSYVPCGDEYIKIRLCIGEKKLRRNKELQCILWQSG
jgi:hypothetical protein